MSGGDDGDSSSSDDEPRLVPLDEHNDEDRGGKATQLPLLSRTQHLQLTS